jgi:hypothetical protein
MSDRDKAFLGLFIVAGVLGMLFGTGYALSEGMSTGRVIGHVLSGFATGAAMLFVLVLMVLST